MIDQQEGTEAGASGDDLGAPFSLFALSKSALTHHPQVAVALPAAVVRSPREVRRASLPCPVWTGQQTPPAACASGGAAPMHREFGGRRPPTSCAGYIPGHCLPLLSVPIIES